MASSFTVPFVSELIELCANGLRTPIIFLVDANGVASVSSLHPSIKFSLQDSTIWVERKIYDSATSLLSLTMHEDSRVADNGSSMWVLCVGKYRVYGFLDFCTNVSTEICTPLHSSASTLNTHPVFKLKIEPGIHNVIHLSSSSNGDEPLYPLLFTSHLHPPSVPPLLPRLFCVLFLHPLPNLPSPFFNVYVLLLPCPVGKNILKKLDYDNLQIEEVDFLRLRFDENQMFVLPLVGVLSSHTKAKSMDGMDKRYDGHVWTKTQTTNIGNDIGLAFRSSTCVGHLQCQNPLCNYLQCTHRTSLVNDTDFDGFTKEPFPIGGPLPLGSTLMCRICKEPPRCIAPCHVKIFYVHNNDTT